MGLVRHGISPNGRAGNCFQRRHEVGRRGYNVLKTVRAAFIGRNPGASRDEFGEALDEQTPGVYRFLQKMAATYRAEGRAADGRGLIELAGEKRGRRVPGCSLTEKGEALYRRIGDVREG